MLSPNAGGFTRPLRRARDTCWAPRIGAKRRREHQSQGRAGQNAIVTEAAAHGILPELWRKPVPDEGPDVKTHPRCHPH